MYKAIHIYMSNVQGDTYIYMSNVQGDTYIYICLMYKVIRIYMLLLLFLPLSGRHQIVDYSATLIILPIMSNVQGDTLWTSSSSTGGNKW